MYSMRDVSCPPLCRMRHLEGPKTPVKEDKIQVKKHKVINIIFRFSNTVLSGVHGDVDAS